MTRRSGKRSSKSTASSTYLLFMLISKYCFLRAGGSSSLVPSAFAFVNNYGFRSSAAASCDTACPNRSIVSTTKALNRRNDNEKFGILTSLFSSPPAKEEVDPGAVEGTDLRIVKYPHPSLRAENVEVTLPEEQDSISKLAREMLKIMYAAEGVGLAAPQIGVNKRLMVYNPTGNSKKWMDETILVNPRIVEYSEGRDEEIEGCLSFPDMQGEVIRSKWIKVEAMTPKGRKIKKKFKGWEARIFQHEYDHLDGTVYIDRLSDETKEKVQPRLNELIEEYDGDDGVV